MCRACAVWLRKARCMGTESKRGRAEAKDTLFFSGEELGKRKSKLVPRYKTSGCGSRKNEKSKTPPSAQGAEDGAPVNPLPNEGEGTLRLRNLYHARKCASGPI